MITSYGVAALNVIDEEGVIVCTKLKKVTKSTSGPPTRSQQAACDTVCTEMKEVTEVTSDPPTSHQEAASAADADSSRENPISRLWSKRRRQSETDSLKPDPSALSSR
jgi:hypothetical protein